MVALVIEDTMVVKCEATSDDGTVLSIPEGLVQTSLSNSDPGTMENTIGMQSIQWLQQVEKELATYSIEANLDDWQKVEEYHILALREALEPQLIILRIVCSGAEIDTNALSTVRVSIRHLLTQILSVPEVDPIITSMSECGICLGTDDECSITAHLPCGHEFCKPCLHRHVVSELLKRRNAWCPTCRHPIEDEDVKQLCPGALEEVHDRAGTGAAEIAAPPPATWIERKMQAYRFRRAAQRAHLKYCPRCRFAIEKNHGCNHMTCRCGHGFDWAEAETVVACHRVHRGTKFFVWGSTCPGCSALAKVKLAALRTTLVIGAVPTAVIGAAIAVLAAPVMGIMRKRKRLRQQRLRLSILRYEHALDDSDSWHGETMGE